SMGAARADAHGAQRHRRGGARGADVRAWGRGTRRHLRPGPHHGRHQLFCLRGDACVLGVVERVGRVNEYTPLGRNVPGYSGFAPENLTTFAHFSVSSTMSFWKSAGDPARGVPPRSIRRARIWGSTRPALIAPFRVLMIATGVFLGAATPHQLL